MLDKNIFGYVALFCTILSGVPYIVSILRGQTKPHLFTHILWFLMSAIAAAGQYVGGAGPGAWATILSALFCLVTSGLAVSHGERTITWSDWVSFLIGLSAIPLWYITSNPLPAVILSTLIDSLGFYPTFRKSYDKPHQENMLSYVASNMKHTASLLAMTVYSTTTLFYPIVMFVNNSAFIAMLIWRRSKKV